MTQKVLGALIIIAVIFGMIFLIKFVPIYIGNAELDEAFQDCISRFEQEKEAGCKKIFAQIIEKNGLNLNVDDIRIDAAVSKKGSYVEADYTQVIDFFGIWQYKHNFHLHREGTPPRRT